MKRGRFFAFGAVSVIAATLIFAFGGLPGKGMPAQGETSGQDELLAGRNVNMVSGTRLPWGDPWLQRQNEPSLAASTRNPMHLLAGANDYRTIDIPDDFKVPGIPPQAAARDAWLGLFKSLDGGESWITTLLPGYPQDDSPEGLASPIHGFEAACDPCVRAGANGLFFYSGIAFNRYGGAGAAFLARFIDNNNLESVKKTYVSDPAYPEDPWQWTVEDDPIKYVDTQIIDTGNPGQFIDMPTVLADIPRNAFGGSTTVEGQSIPNANVYMAYTVFLGNFDISVRSRLSFVRSTNCGQTWSKPIKLSESQHVIQRPVIAIDPHDPTGNTIYVAFRRFAHGTMPGGIAICKSVDGGLSFTKAIEVETLLTPFDQQMDASMFRTNSYPTMAVDEYGIVYIAWAQLTQLMNGSGTLSRIVLKTSANGVDWSGTAEPIDLTDELGAPLLGNQFMPALTIAGGRRLLAWYDQRETLSPENNTGQVADNEPHRQTIDVRAAEIVASPFISVGPSYQVSRYLYYLELGPDGEPVEENGYYKAIQAEYYPPNLPLFQLGTRPFVGDYIDMAPAPLMLPPPVGGGSWAYNTIPFDNPVMFHAAWTDNRDVRPPADGWWGNWANYNPPSSPQEGIFSHDGPCDTSTTGMRNQNVYTANVAKDVFVGSPWNSKQLNLSETLDGGGRTFVVLVKNFTDLDKSINLAIQEIGGVNASFDQMTDVNTLDIEVAAYSSYSCTVFVDAANDQLLPVKVNAKENGLLVGYALLNPDQTTLPVDDPDGGTNNAWYEKHNPRVQNPRVHNYDLGNKNEPNPRVMNPRVHNPRVMNPRVMNPRVMNPRVMNPRVMNPRVMNDSIVNQEVANPRVMNPRVMNTALSDVTWIVSNEGNTTSAYTFNIVSTVDNYFSTGDPNIITPLIGQVLVYKLHLVPGAYGCDLYETHEDELLVNYTNPRVMNPRVMNTAPSDSQTMSTLASNGDEEEEFPKDITFWLAPGEEAYVTFRVWDDDTTDNISFSAQTVAPYVEADAINTGETEPSYAIPDDDVPWVNPLPQIGVYPNVLSFYAAPEALPLSQQLTIWNAGAGSLEYTITVDVPWLSVSPTSGTSASAGDEHNHLVSIPTGLLEGVYEGAITISDPAAANNPLRIPVTFTVATVPPPVRSEWIARFNGPGNDIDQMRAIALDAAGNIYVVGAVTVSGTDMDYMTIKYDPSGNVLWTARYDGPGHGYDFPNAIAVDPLGNVVVTGQSLGTGTDADYATIRYDSSGNQVWVARYDGAGHGFDTTYHVALDTLGNAYVTGFSRGDGTQNDIVTIKYNGTTGSTAWQAVYNSPANGIDGAFEVELDPLGNVYVAGESANDAIVLKYDGNGNPLWQRTYDGPGSARDVANELAVDPAGNVYAGCNSVGDGTGNDYATIMYDTNGNEMWVSRYTGSGDGSDSIQELIVGPDGDVYVTGSSARTGTLTDIMTIRYVGATGDVFWRTRYSTGSDGESSAFEMALDPSGALYVVGDSTGDSGARDVITIKYGPGGQQDWIRRYHGPGAGDDIAHEILVDASGSVIIGGTSYGDASGADIVTIKYLPELEEWHAEFDGSAHGDDVPTAIAVDGSGNTYVAATSKNGDGNADLLILKYDPSGAQLWEAVFDGSVYGDDIPSAIAVDTAGNVYVTGSSQSASAGMDIITMMYDNDGNYIWGASYGGDGEELAHAIAVDTNGVYVTGRSFNGVDFDWITIKYSLSGTRIWGRPYDNDGGDWPFAIGVDSAGDVYVAGESVRISGGTPSEDTEMTTIKYDGTTGDQLAIDRYHYLWDMGQPSINQAVDIAIREVDGTTMIVVTGIGDNFEAGSDFVTIRYDTNLARQWEATYNGLGGDNDIPFGVEIDAEGNVLVTGESVALTPDIVTVKYDPEGNAVWVNRFDGLDAWNDSPTGLALDSEGNAYVTGWTQTSSGHGTREFVTLKYDPDGVERWATFYRGGLWGEDMARAVAVDPAGNALVTGQTQFYATGPIIHWNIRTYKYRKEGF